MPTPVEYDPFAGTAPTVSGEGEPVDYDPFATSAGEPVEGDPFASVPKNKEDVDERTIGEEVARQIGRTADITIKGLTGFPLLIGDAANSLLNFIPGVNLGSPSQIVREGLAEAGLPQPEGAVERVVGLTGEALTGTGGGIKTAAKYTVGPVRRFLTEEAGQQLAAGTAAGAGAGLAIENDIGPAGILFAGLAGGVGGAVAARQASRGIARWADQRVHTDAPVSAEEVEAVAKAHGMTPTDDELKMLTESLEELRTAQKADAEIAKMKPLESDPVEVRRAKAAAIKRMGGAEKGDLPIETQRELRRMRARDIEKLEAKIRAKEAQKVAAQPAVKEVHGVTDKLAEAAAPATVDGPTIKGVDKPIPMSKWGNDVISRIENVSPRLGMAVRRVTQRANTRSAADIKKVDKFYKSPEYRRLSSREKDELDLAFLNGDKITQGAIMGRYRGLQDLYNQNVASLLAGVQRQRVAGGADGFIESFHPRAVVRLKALQNSRGKEVKGKVEQALADLRRDKRRKGEGDPSEHEVAVVIGRAIGGRAAKVLKDRRINEITPEQQKYYARSRDSLIDYLHRHNDAIATQAFFKSELGVSKNLGQTIDEEGLYRILARSVEKGDLSGDQLDELVPLLAAQYGVSRQAVGATQRRVKNLFTFGTLANPISTVTQFGDIGPVMNQFGVAQTLRSLFGPKATDVYEVGVRELAKDARTARGTARLVRQGLEAVGFDKLDKIMANTAVNAGFSKYIKLARKNPNALRKQLSQSFNEGELDNLIADLQARRLSDDVKTLLLHDVGEIRPVAREDMPLQFQQWPGGRFNYSLLSWSIKQMNYLRNSAMRDFAAGRKTRATVDFLKFLTLMGLTNGTVQEVKRFIRGEDPDPVGSLVTGALALGMSGKFFAEALSRGEGGEAFANLIPFWGILGDELATGVSSAVRGEYSDVFDGIPTFRNYMAILEGDLPAAAGGAALSLIPEADAAFATPEQRLPAGAIPLPAQNIPAENDLPAGSVALPDPGQLAAPAARPEDELRLRAAIEQEQLRRTEVPTSAPEAESVPKNSPTEFIAQAENNKALPFKQSGWKPEAEKWYPHKSVEGGTRTLAYGHKLTAPEVKSGKVEINGEKVNYKEGITDAQAKALLAKDTRKAELAVDKLVKRDLTPAQRTALVSLVYNAGVQSFANSKALKALNRGDLEEFRKQAFSREQGWTKVTIDGEKQVHEGLLARRQAEERLFFGG